MYTVLVLLALITLLLTQPVRAMEWSGWLAADYQHFPREPLYPGQRDDSHSAALQLQVTHQWDSHQQQFEFVPFARYDPQDDERSHTDIRELSWLYAARSWELRAGIRRVFWGVTESQHLVDVINQTDSVEGMDGEDKLGQPMLNLALIRDWGTLDVYVLPYFRQRTFLDSESRLSLPLPVDIDHARYESADEEHHIDYAARWSHYFGDWDIGLSYFDGTRRAPVLIAEAGQFIPLYVQMQQWGLDIQATKNSWLWKLEAIHRSLEKESYRAATAGFEYSLYDLMESGHDLGLVVEYLYDERGEEADTPYEDDLMLGLRWVMNDEQSSEALLGMIRDRKTHSTIYTLEASRRLGERWKATVESFVFNQSKRDDPMYIYRQDDFLRLELSYYF